jgi:hypothetical protein
MKIGYVALHRKIQDHAFYKEKRVFSKYEAWIDILMEAQHKLEDQEVIIGMRSVTCGYGQSVKSLRTWAQRWQWSAKKVSRFFDLLKKMNQIRLENVTVTSRLTVLNYGKYDPKCHTYVTEGKQKGNSCDTRSTHECPTDNNDKNVNNVNNDNKKTLMHDLKKSDELLSEFEKFWNLYQKKKDHKKCLAKWKLLTKKEKEDIFNCVSDYVKSTPDPKYRKNPLTWINGRCWEDEIDLNNKTAQRDQPNLDKRALGNAKACYDFINE